MKRNGLPILIFIIFQLLRTILKCSNNNESVEILLDKCLLIFNISQNDLNCYHLTFFEIILLVYQFYQHLFEK